MPEYLPLLRLHLPLTSGIYKGVVVFQDRNSKGSITISGNGHLHTTGTVYAPKATVTLSGNGAEDNPIGISLGSEWIIDDLVLSGNARFIVAANANNRN